MQSIFSSHNEMKLEINNSKMFEKFTNKFELVLPHLSDFQPVWLNFSSEASHSNVFFIDLNTF